MEQVRVLPVVQLRSRSGRRGLWPGLYPARRHVGQTIILRSAVLWHFPVRLSRRFPSLSHPLSPSSTQAGGQRPPPVCPFRLIALVHGVPILGTLLLLGLGPLLILRALLVLGALVFPLGGGAIGFHSYHLTVSSMPPPFPLYTRSKIFFQKKNTQGWKSML